MRIRRILCATFLGAALIAPAHAEGNDPFAQLETLLDPKVLLKGVVREDDVSLLFAHLRAALLAAVEGRKPPAPAELDQRAEAIGNELKLRGTLVGLLLLTAFEAAARQAVRDALAEPAPAAR
ncbi:MAG: hypothetical protein HYV99_01930 [Betaproteobacteria bacterium]|nr:hypothetical protein [Betaproteobacteria bacterium]MBI2508780.1 hypothetical protein [Betaproteobacteria bacterium]